MNVFNAIKKSKNNRKQNFDAYQERFEKYAYTDCGCESEKQFEASIIRLYHTIEKGLSYEDYRPGFGKQNVEKLLTSLEQYSASYDINVFFYQTALSCLGEYVTKNHAHGYSDPELEARIHRLPGQANDMGGTAVVSAPCGNSGKNYEQTVLERHSIRHFSNVPVSTDQLKSAIELAQHTPSACNRQCWKTRIIADRKKIEGILANQNGNRGFGQEIDKILLITADLRAQQKSRELFQAFIDGGMYAESILNALFYYGIGAVPLSAALTSDQEKNIRKLTGMHDAEVFIMFVGVGNYPEGEILTTRSQRKPTDIEIL